MDLSILIVNWNSARYLKACLSSLFREVKGIEFEVLVVDNASYDGSAELVSEDFPQVTFVQSEKNLGFTRGNNLLFRRARGRNILLLNPDTEVVGDAIQKMLGHLERLPQAGAIGCRLVDAQGALQTTILAFPTIWNQLLDIEFLQQRFPNCSLWKLKPLYDNGPTPVEVDALAGACFMVKRHVFERVGLMTEDYVMYGDDIELSYKIWKAGYKVLYTNQSRVIHYEGKSAESWKRGLPDVWKRASIYRFLRASHGRCYCACYKAAMAFAAFVRLISIGLMKPLVGNPRRKEKLSLAFTKWKRLFQWSVGMRGWARRAGEEAGFATDEW
jgi:GT2 family glycosyltransferase